MSTQKIVINLKIVKNQMCIFILKTNTQISNKSTTIQKFELVA